MTKYSQLKDFHREAVKDFLLQVVNIKAQEEQYYSAQIIKIMFYSNVAGLAAVTTFVGILVQSSKSPSAFIWSLIFYLIGAAVATLLQGILLTASNTSVKQLGNQYEALVSDKIELEQFKGWGLNKRGVIVVRSMQYLAFIFFGLGTWSALSGLYSL